MALYAELHHERYDGRGYYSVPQREIPIEAHVLIVADSFDAMTSVRAYRPALTTTEAVLELRDKAGSQFHPLVAEAFAAMVEDRDVQAAMGPAAARRAASRVRAGRHHPASVVFDSLAQPRMLTVALAAATAVSVGMPAAPAVLSFGVGALAIVAGATAIAAGIRERRRRRLAHAALAGGGSATAALAAAGRRRLGRLAALERIRAAL